MGSPKCQRIFSKGESHNRDSWGNWTAILDALAHNKNCCDLTILILIKVGFVYNRGNFKPAPGSANKTLLQTVGSGSGSG